MVVLDFSSTHEKGRCVNQSAVDQPAMALAYVNMQSPGRLSYYIQLYPNNSKVLKSNTRYVK